MHYRSLLLTVAILGAVANNVSVGQLRLLSPDGAEVFHQDDVVPVLWTGVEQSQSVSLSYSLDQGATWNSIVPSAAGLRYLWHVPKVKSSTCLLRATAENP